MALTLQIYIFLVYYNYYYTIAYINIDSHIQLHFSAYLLNRLSKQKLIIILYIIYKNIQIAIELKIKV